MERKFQFFFLKRASLGLYSHLMDYPPKPLPPGLDPRAAAVLREIVEQYVGTGEPVGSRTLARRLPIALSPATIRNVMADLTDAGLLFAPHTSAGRLPTDRGLRLFVDGLLQFGDLSLDERETISRQLAAHGRSLQDTLSDASTMLSGLSQAAGMVLAPKSDSAIKHIEFASLGSGRALVILVSADGQVENRVIQIPPGLPPSALTEAANYLNARAAGRTLMELRRRVAEEMAQDRGQLDLLAAGVVESGLATWTDVAARGGVLIVRGQSRLLADVTQIENLAAIQVLFDRLETQETMLRLLELAEQSDGVRIFIGAESALFGSTGVSIVQRRRPHENAEAADDGGLRNGEQLSGRRRFGDRRDQQLQLHGLARLRAESGLRQSVPCRGYEREVSARLHGRRGLGCDDRDLQDRCRAKRFDRSRTDDGVDQGLQDGKPARPDHDRSVDARHRGKLLPAPRREKKRQARERGVPHDPDGARPQPALTNGPSVVVHVVGDDGLEPPALAM